MTNRYLLDIERLKKLDPILEGLGVEATGVINNGELIPNVIIEHAIGLDGNKLPGFLAAFTIFQEGIEKYEASWIVNPDQKTYDYASLESVLPDWEEGFDVRYCPVKLSIFNYPLPKEDKRPVMKMNQLLAKGLLGRGQAKLEAMADLIILLHENGIELRMNDEI